MSIEVLLSFILASMALCFTPGPTVFLVISQGLIHGKKAVLPTVFGVICGDIIALTGSLLGVGAILATSATAFAVMKWLGAIYLVYLGVKAWRSPVSEAQDTPMSLSTNRLKVFKDALLVTALNPKGLVFFMAFFPLFIDQSTNVLTQMVTLGCTFIAVSMASVCFYTFFGGYIKEMVVTTHAQRIFNRTSGGLMISAGVVTSSLEK